MTVQPANPLMLTAQRLASRAEGRTVSLVDPPFCYGAWRGPRVDVSMLGSVVRRERASGARGVVLSDIPDDDDSLVAALALPGVLGALAIGCACLDVWVSDATAAAAMGDGLTVRRTPASPVARIEAVAPDQIRRLWRLLEELAPR